MTPASASVALFPPRAPVTWYCTGAMQADRTVNGDCCDCRRLHRTPGRRAPIREIVPQIISGRVHCSHRVPYEA